MESKPPLSTSWGQDPDLVSRDQIRKALSILFADDGAFTAFDENDFPIQDESVSRGPVRNKGRKPNAT